MTLAVVVLASLCIVFSLKCFLGVYDRSEGICLWQSILPTLLFRSDRSFVKAMSSLEKHISFCIRHAPRPDCVASASMVTGSLT